MQKEHRISGWITCDSVTLTSSTYVVRCYKATPLLLYPLSAISRVANSHVDSVTPFRSMILSCQRSPNLINIQLRRRVVGYFIGILHMKRKKETLQGLRKNMQLKMIFKGHIDRLSTDVRLNNKYDMVCGIIFFPRFYITDFLIQYNTSKTL